MKRIQHVRVLKEKIGESGADALVHYVDASLTENNKYMYTVHIKAFANKVDNLAKEQEKMKVEMKKEFSILRTEMKEEFSSVRAEMKEDFSNVRAEMKEEFSDVRAEMKDSAVKGRDEWKESVGRLELIMTKTKGELEVKISDFRSDILRWMFALFVTMLLAILGLYLKK